MAQLVDHGADIHKQIKDARTALHLSAEQGKLEADQYVLEQGVQVDAPNSVGRSPLHVAASKGDVRMMALLSEHAADVHQVTEDGMSALHESAWNGKAEAVRLLLERGAEEELADHDGWTALHFAADRGDVDTIALLVKHHANVHAVTETPLYMAADRGDIPTMQILIEHGADMTNVTKYGHNILHQGVYRGHTSAALYALDLGLSANVIADNDGNWETARMLAIGYSDLSKASEMALLLCSRGAEWNKDHHHQALLANETRDDKAGVGAEDRRTRRQGREGLCLCVDHWSRGHIQTKVPTDVVAQGAASVAKFVGNNHP